MSGRHLQHVQACLENKCIFLFVVILTAGELDIFFNLMSSFAQIRQTAFPLTSPLILPAGDEAIPIDVGFNVVDGLAGKDCLE